MGSPFQLCGVNLFKNTRRNAWLENMQMAARAVEAARVAKRGKN